jgi:hypothetical protein
MAITVAAHRDALPLQLNLVSANSAPIGGIALREPLRVDQERIFVRDDVRHPAALVLPRPFSGAAHER